MIFFFLLLLLLLLFCCFCFCCHHHCCYRHYITSAADNDYKPVMDILTIPQGTTLDSFKSSDYCVNVTIIGDNLRELNESFIVVFNAYPDIFQGADNVTITILDDGDGTFILRLTRLSFTFSKLHVF